MDVSRGVPPFYVHSLLSLHSRLGDTQLRLFQLKPLLFSSTSMKHNGLSHFGPKNSLVPWLHPERLLGASWCLLMPPGASWCLLARPGCLLGAPWVPPGCPLGAFRSNYDKFKKKPDTSRPIRKLAYPKSWGGTIFAGKNVNANKPLKA